MKVAFRADASLQIGSGHVMRCLTLAEALRAKGAECHFICREHPGNLLKSIRDKGFNVYALASDKRLEPSVQAPGNPRYWAWLGASQELDAEQCAKFLEVLQPNWLVVDHYALDITWELRLKKNGVKLLVIDDLADRNHISDILLDQTFGRKSSDYFSRVPLDCVVLCGSKYALLRPDFIKLRPYSLSRRSQYRLESVLVTLGGVDKNNVTRQVLEGLKVSALPKNCRITVVMGATAPWLEDIQHLAITMPWHIDVKVDVSDMAQLMAESDLSIGAAGATSWERCCLGVPTIMVVLADNQKFAASLLERAKAVLMISSGSGVTLQLTRAIEDAVNDPDFLKSLSESSKMVTDGAGCERLLKAIANSNIIDG
ncbi:UDP-2,4-diacetamido-2,4,6-trideoxy-beta-L-altropyranose hydrolase [Pseudomonas brassicacearum]|uniref:UDP-2,4-diacetamido-2,4, 6-trideoxy-beta-L-altropyranose hydrolase n=1 Tax=Pseudomonas brassicacearum TaxID=930166 RepID=A0AAJ3FTJ7_9PSED|nr:UDP-2,4-diacetamido-2,4,6-trideoxy-beta-L-altropyranose hydrolase [Pseudomonas brassicacearum]NUT79800.1 UDP-2,4-diacetamido-2,4,6-trideoxy-beta-L-altropyranose hydrolase [Pseudomonas brassicacearum]